MKLITVKELSELTSIKEATIYLWAAKGDIPHYKIGQLVRFNPKEVEDWLEKHKKENNVSEKKPKKRKRVSSCSDANNIVRKAIDEVTANKI